MEVTISSRAGHELQFLTDLPPNLQPYRLRGATPIVTTAGFGDLAFQHFPGKHFDIWYSTYAITTPATLTGRADIPVLELHIPFHNRMHTRWDGIGELAMLERQFDLSFTPFVQTEVAFNQVGEYHTFDVHYHKEMLQPFAAHFPALDRFLHHVEKGQPASLLATERFLSAGMLAVINDMLHYDFIDAVAPAFYESKVLELLIHMLRCLSEYRPAPKFTTGDLERAEHASFVILSDLERQFTATELARATGTNVYTLKLAFRHLYGCSLFKFGEQARMDYARQLLLEGKLNIMEVSRRVGYPDAQNFAIAFKRFFKMSPSELKGKKR